MAANRSPKCGRRVKIIAVAIVLFMMISVEAANGSETSYFVIGAYGDDGSKGNTGVRVEIRTRAYVSSFELENGRNRTSDSFFLEESFSDGSKIDFGFTPFLGEPNWYWIRSDSNGQVEDGRGGPIGSAGLNGTWHSYSIELIPTGQRAIRYWNLVFDGTIIAMTEQTQSESKAETSVVLFEAVKATFSETNLSLGPVEFRSLSYLSSDGWHGVTSLRVVTSCSVDSQCTADFPFGITELGPNHVIVGSGVPKHQNGEILWTLNPIDYVSPYFSLIALIALVIIFAYFSVRRRFIIFPSQKPTAI